MPLALAEDNPYNIMIAPHTLELQVKKGEAFEKRIKILNKGAIDIPMKAKITDFTAEDETGKMIFGSGSESVVSPAKWIEMEKPDFILSPQETYSLDFYIKIPEDTVPGGYYATVIFEPQLPSVYFEKDASRAIPEIGALILFAVEIEGVERGKEAISVSKFGIPEKYHLQALENAIERITGAPPEAMASEREEFSIVENSKLSFDIQIKNEDIFHNKFFGKLEIMSNDNKRPLGETEVSRITILPGKSRSFPIEFDSDLPKGLWGNLPFGISSFIKENFTWGKYKVKLTLFQEDPRGLAASGAIDNSKTEEIIEFWIFPWKTAIMFVVTVIVIILIRKRIIAAGKILLKKHKIRTT